MRRKAEQQQTEPHETRQRSWPRRNRPLQIPLLKRSRRKMQPRSSVLPDKQQQIPLQESSLRKKQPRG
jgi:hypothetical protein